MKELKDYTGEELAEVLSGEFQKLLQAQLNLVSGILTLHMIQNELEKRKLDGKS